jgi:GT2 family glycosyltransferase
MIGHAQRAGIGAVGCRLIAPEGELRQGGMRVDLGGLETGEPDDSDPFPHFDRLTLNPAVVSLDCMVLERSLFEAAGGFDDQHLKGDFFDLDLCFRLGEIGLRNVCTPHVTMVCPSRARRVSAGDIAYMWERWWDKLAAALAHQRDPNLPPTALSHGGPR